MKTPIPIPTHPDDDIAQARSMYRDMSEAERQRLVQRLAATLTRDDREDVILASVRSFASVDEELGGRLMEAVSILRAARRQP